MGKWDGEGIRIRMGDCGYSKVVYASIRERGREKDCGGNVDHILKPR